MEGTRVKVGWPVRRPLQKSRQEMAAAYMSLEVPRVEGSGSGKSETELTGTYLWPR